MTITPLDGYVVVDLSTGIAGAYCTKLLADGCARVVKVEPPEDGALFSFLAAGKELAADAPLVEADAIVWSPGAALTIDEVRAAAPRATITAITHFGLEGPWAGKAATEFTLQAWSGGIIGLGRGAPDRPPVFVGGQIGEWLTGTYAAIGTLASLARDDRVGELVDVSMLETLALSLTYYPVTFFDMVGRPMRPGRQIVPPGVETASDGLVGVGVGTGQQWHDFCVMVEHPEWMEDRKLFASRGHLRPEIAAWMEKRSVAEILDIAGAFRIPHAPVGNGATIPETDHFVERGSIVDHGAYRAPGRPYRFDSIPSELVAPEACSRTSGATSSEGLTFGGLPFEGLRVLDLTAFWAGPLCTHILGMLGAEVLHIESTSRPDGTRLLSGLRWSEADWWEQSGIFAGLNTNKKSVTLDLATDAGRDLLRRLIATCDVIVENNTPRVLDQLGFDVEAVRAIKPDIVMVRMPGFGLDGPWRDNPAFAFVIEDAAGLTWLTGYPDENPISPYCVGDSNAGTHALCGLLLALEHRRRTGESVIVEASMVDAALNVAAAQVIEYSTNGVVLQRDGNRGPTAAPQNLYRTADEMDDPYVAIAIATDEQWLALRDALGQPTWAMNDALTTAAGRRQQHDAIDDNLTPWCASRTGNEIVDSLWAAGVPVAKVMQPHEQPTLAQLQFRGFFEDVDRAVTGTSRHATLPIRFSRGPERFHRDPAPLLGEHNNDVLGALGVTDAEMTELDDQGVIGRVPVAARK